MEGLIGSLYDKMGYFRLTLYLFEDITEILLFKSKLAYLTSTSPHLFESLAESFSTNETITIQLT